MPFRKAYFENSPPQEGSFSFLKTRHQNRRWTAARWEPGPPDAAQRASGQQWPLPPLELSSKCHYSRPRLGDPWPHFCLYPHFHTQNTVRPGCLVIKRFWAHAEQWGHSTARRKSYHDGQGPNLNIMAPFSVSD